jgi:chromate transport protein ChrA
MNKGKIRNVVGIFMIVSHFVVILLIIYYRFQNKYDDDTLKTSLPVIIPLFATYTTMIVRHSFENQAKASVMEGASVMYTFIAFFIPFVFFVFLLAIVVNQATSPLSLENFAAYLGLCETIFGIYLGIILKDMFRTTEK